jgi:malonyl-CoA O-methyltransferase
MTLLSVKEAYGLWSRSYADETAVSFLETGLAQALTGPLTGLRLLDAGCGTGRRLKGTGALLAVGVDVTPEMIAAGPRADAGVKTIVADVRDLPLADRSFDAIWCRLVIGHIPDCAPVYRELARVADAGARLVVTDFHPDAHAAGHRRTFRHGGQVHEIEHYVHGLADHVAAARAAGWRLRETRDAVIGPETRPFYENAGRSALYAEHQGLAVVIGLAFEREG